MGFLEKRSTHITASISLEQRNNETVENGNKDERTANMFAPVNEYALHTVISAVRKFSAEFYKRLAEDETNKNIICSPTNVSIALSMLQVGARDYTKKQLISALNLPFNDAMIRDGFKSLMETFKMMDESKLHFANKIYIDKKISVKPDFVIAVKSSFQSAIENIDFDDAVRASKTICTWCEEKTNHHIKDIVDEGSLEDAEMILVCTVYFRGLWKNSFRPKMEQYLTFHIDERTSKQVLMMAREVPTDYYEVADLDANCFKLFYKENHQSEAMSMYVIRPNTINGLNKIEENLHKINFSQLRQIDGFFWAYLKLPKFKFHCSFDLSETLQKMGVEDAFQEASANFTGIRKNPPIGLPLVITKIIHKTSIEVNEYGTEAASATRMLLRGAGFGVVKPIPTICVDRPFLCMIVAEKTGLPIFIARISDPTSSS